MPTASSAASSSRPAGPTNGRPSRSSRSPGCSPTNMTLERKWWTLLAVCVATFMLLVDVTIVNVALPSIQRELDASLTSLQWVVDAYALTLSALLLTAGSLADRLGRRRVFAVGVGIFPLASLGCGLARD